MKPTDARFVADLVRDWAGWSPADVPGRLAALSAIYRASGDADGVVQIEAADCFYLDGLIRGDVELVPEIVHRLESMFEVYSSNPEMLARLDCAASAYGDAAVKAAHWHPAEGPEVAVIATAMTHVG